ncbi:hypothetical protein [Oribacterium sp. P6A1]|uniref:hypothetical protein n=1 Tax=Oribacterium sp. P6A1 TaxID=1410612 RepID=UPI000569E578|nr:hypothetical protein [Oribacterium sp. P6A1]
MTGNSLTRSKLSLNTLRSPESKLITAEKLIRQNKYQFAVKKWGIACGEIAKYTKRAKTLDILGEAKRLYDISVAQGRKLYKYFDINKKLKFIAFRIIYPWLKYL